MRNIAILGSTGSIGRSSLEVIQTIPDQFRATYLTTNRNIELLNEQIRRFSPKGVVVLDHRAAAALSETLNGTTEVLVGEKGLLEIVRRDDVDLVISSLVGFAGLRPTIEAIRHRKTIALANKETLVVAGEIITGLVDEYGVKILPIDSEHSAIMQCLAGEDPATVLRLILTASGGPFYTRNKEDFCSITVDEALKHPNWKMGNKITIDSATLMNKGLEVIEAHWLFHIPPEKIDVVIHPQSIIHSMVEFIDGSIKAQLGIPDMKIPIQYALTYPKRIPSHWERLDFSTFREMTFVQPDIDKFECLGLAFEAIGRGGSAPAVINAANEVAVDLFLNRKLQFPDIPRIIRTALDHQHIVDHPELPHIIEADRSTRAMILEQY
ncbi:MAG: 1-deoxy-D-xylulose-5-phosphate reductoisomerase [Bacteroidota bacterium]